MKLLNANLKIVKMMLFKRVLTADVLAMLPYANKYC